MRNFTLTEKAFSLRETFFLTDKSPVNKLFAIENTYHDTNQADKASHKEIASSSPAVVLIVNIRERSEFYFTTYKNRLFEYDG